MYFYIIILVFFIHSISCYKHVDSTKGGVPINNPRSNKAEYFTNDKYLQIFHAHTSGEYKAPPYYAVIAIKYGITRQDSKLDKKSIIKITEIDENSYVRIRLDALAFLNNLGCQLTEDKTLYKYSELNDLYNKCDYIKNRISSSFKTINGDLSVQQEDDSDYIHTNDVPEDNSMKIESINNLYNRIISS